MEKLKSFLFFIIILAILGLLGYWAFGTIQSGDQYTSREEIKKLKAENETLKKQVEELNIELTTLRPVVEEPNGEELAPVIKKEEPAKVIAKYENQDLIDELQKLINDGVVMRLKSVGTRVGTVQKFLNIYNKTFNRIDNDFGESTKKAIIEFQKAQGLPADGETGKTTFQKMIDWLKKQ